MRALFVAPYLPTPGSGGRTRLINLLERLGADHELHLVAFRAPDQDGSSPLPGAVIDPPPRRRRPGGIPGVVRFYAEKLDPLPAFVSWVRSPEMRHAVRAACARFRPEIVQVETTEMGQYLSDVPHGVARALDLQDVASRWFSHTVGKEDQSRQERAMMAIELGKTRRYEKRIARLPDAVFVSSEHERGFLRDFTGVDAIEVPNGVDTRSFVPMPEVAEQRDTIAFVGPLTYDANLDGVRWFARDILPLIRREHPAARLELIGTPAEEDFGDGVQLLGRVDDVRPHVARAAVSVVPVRLGSGTRYKILEALSMERAVVSTTLGADGLGVVDREHLLIADEPERFARAVVELLEQPKLRAELGAKGRSYVAARYDWGLLTGRISDAWDQAVARRRATTSDE
ncbi:MAG TPA: glycosyltransferase family 4 protein [Actinomycetota bacterium]